MSENTNNVTEEKKELSKTEQFKVHLQKIIFQELGIKVSKDKAWSLFKATINGTVEHVLNVPDKKIPLAGIGTFEILETKPRGSKAGLDKDGQPVEGAEAWPFVPRFRFYPSSVIDNRVEKAYGLGDHADLEDVHYGIYKADEAPVEKEEKKEKKVAKKTEKKEDAPVADDFAGLDDM